MAALALHNTYIMEKQRGGVLKKSFECFTACYGPDVEGS
jgi:hypothetical protein